MARLRWQGWWDPFSSLRYMQREFERLLGRGFPFGESRAIGGGVYPPVNVFNGPNDILVQCDVAGVKPDDLDISITGETLMVKGVKKGHPDEEKLTFQRRERGMGEFSRTIILPDKIDADRVEAKLNLGVLTVRLPKSEAARPRQIKVNA
jgi:HSP20 family protein